MRVKIHGDILTVRNICAAHLLNFLPDPLFLHLLTVLGPSRLPCKGHTDSSLSLCLHLGLANGEHQQEIGEKLNVGDGELCSLASCLPGCPRLALSLPRLQFLQAFPASRFVSALTFGPHSLRKMMVPAVSAHRVQYYHCGFTDPEPHLCI